MDHMFDTNKFFYSIPRECGCEYVGESYRGLSMRIELMYKGVVLHILRQLSMFENHNISFYVCKVVNKKVKWFKCRFKGAAFITNSNNCISQPRTFGFEQYTIVLVSGTRGGVCLLHSSHLIYIRALLWHCSVVFLCSALSVQVLWVFCTFVAVLVAWTKRF